MQYAGFGDVTFHVTDRFDLSGGLRYAANTQNYRQITGGAIEAHDVRTRTVGSVTFVEFHLVVPGGMTVEDSHIICDRIERALSDQLGDAVINIHVEPEPKAKLVGVPVL